MPNNALFLLQHRKPLDPVASGGWGLCLRRLTPPRPLQQPAPPWRIPGYAPGCHYKNHSQYWIAYSSNRPAIYNAKGLIFTTQINQLNRVSPNHFAVVVMLASSYTPIAPPIVKQHFCFIWSNLIAFFDWLSWLSKLKWTYFKVTEVRTLAALERKENLVLPSIWMQWIINNRVSILSLISYFVQISRHRNNYDLYYIMLE